MRTTTERYAAFLLTVFAVGALLLPFAHEFTHIRNLEHRHGPAAADHSEIAVGFGVVDYLVEERTVPHNPNCDLCARLALNAPQFDISDAPFRHVDDRPVLETRARASRSESSRQIRAPPIQS